MARQKITTTTRRRKVGGNTGYMPCNICHGTGRVKVPKRKKRRSR